MGKRHKRNDWQSDQYMEECQASGLFYTAGHTSGGAPYGITWEQAEAENLLADGTEIPDIADDDLPF